MHTQYNANVTRGAKYLIIHVPEIDQWTQATQLDEVDTMARDLIALVEEISPESIELKINHAPNSMSP